MSFLEESCRELKMELKIQKSKTKEMEALKESLSKKLLLYRSFVFRNGIFSSSTFEHKLYVYISFTGLVLRTTLNMGQEGTRN